MAQTMMKYIIDATEKINNKLFGKYALTRYLMLYMLRCILENDLTGVELINNPEPFVRNVKNREHLQGCVNKIIGDIIVDINAEVNEFGEEFDYRGKLRDAEWVKGLSKEIVSTYLKMVQRKRLDSFASELKEMGH